MSATDENSNVDSSGRGLCLQAGLVAHSRVTSKYVHWCPQTASSYQAHSEMYAQLSPDRTQTNSIKSHAHDTTALSPNIYFNWNSAYKEKKATFTKAVCCRECKMQETEMISTRRTTPEQSSVYAFVTQIGTACRTHCCYTCTQHVPSFCWQNWRKGPRKRKSVNDRIILKQTINE